MPTGYTCYVRDGISFENWILRCARAFGAFIHMRDDNNDAELKFPKLSTYHEDKLSKYRAERDKIVAMTLPNLIKQRMTTLEKNIKEFKEFIADEAIANERLAAMKAEVEKWNPDSDFCSLRAFMLQQLDVDKPSTFYADELPKMLITLENYTEMLSEDDTKAMVLIKEKRLTHLAEDIAYHVREGKKDRDNIKDKRKWAVKLFKSLDIDYTKLKGYKPDMTKEN